MKIVLDIQVERDLQDNDIIVYRNGKWTVMSKTNFLSTLMENQKNLNEVYSKKIKALEKNLVELANIVKEK